MPVPRSVIVARRARGICQNGNFSKRDFPGHTDCVSDTPCPGGSLFQHRLSGAHELPQAGSPLTGGKFFAEPQRGIRRLRTAGTCADAARAHKRVDTCGFHPLVNHPFPLDSLAKIGERRPLRKGERQRIFSTVGEHSVLPCRNLYAVPDTVLLHRRFHLRRARHSSAAQRFNVLYCRAG